MSCSPSQTPFRLLNSLSISQLRFKYRTQYSCMEASKVVLEQNISYRYNISYGNRIKVKLMHRRHKGTWEKQESQQLKSLHVNWSVTFWEKKEINISSGMCNILPWGKDGKCRHLKVYQMSDLWRRWFSSVGKKHWQEWWITGANYSFFISLTPIIILWLGSYGNIGYQLAEWHGVFQ